MQERKQWKRAGLIILSLIVVSLLVFSEGIQGGKVSASEQENTAVAETLVAKVDNFNIKTKEQISSNINTYLDYDYGSVSKINEFWGFDGNYNVVCTGKKAVYINILNSEMTLLKTLEIPLDLPIVGNAVQDKSGNYYIVYGKYDTAAQTDPQAGTAIVMSIVQYDQNGNQLTRLTYTGSETCPNDGIGWGTKEPFNFGNCDLIIDSTGTLVCRYGRVMYNGHQSSHALYVNTADMTKLSYAAPYNSHSFDQKVIETSDGGYLFADRGDGFQRGFVVFRMNKNTNKYKIPSFVPFHFRNGYIYQTTYATLGGIAECSNGYALSGVSEKTLSYDKAPKEDFNESRDVFLQVFKKNFTSDSTDKPDVQVLNGDTRTAEGTFVSGTGNNESGACDYGVLWLTNYTGNTYASIPKMVNIGNDRLLIMWEKKIFKGEDDNYSYNQYIESCYMVVSSDGTVIIPETAIQDLHLKNLGEPSYKDGSIYWTTSDGKGNALTVHRLAVGETMRAAIHLFSIKPVKDTIVAKAGEKTQIKVTLSPSNADNKNLRYVYDEKEVSVDKDGYITVKNTGSDMIEVVSEEDENISTYVTVNLIDNAPGKLNAVQVDPYYYDDYRVKLTWKKTLYGESYEIYRSSSKDSGYKCIDTTENLYYYDGSVKGNKQYYYKVRALNYWWDNTNLNPFSEPVMAYVLDCPKKAAVSKVSAASAKITWSKLNTASGYEVYCYDNKTKKYVLVQTYKDNTKLAYTKSGLGTGQTYSFKVRAFKTIGGVNYYSTFSEAVKIKF